MRNIKKVVSTGCFIFCLGGWVYNGQAIAADEANQVKEAALNAAVAEAATPGATAKPEIQLVQAAPVTPGDAAPGNTVPGTAAPGTAVPGTPVVAATQAAKTAGDLNTPIVNVDAAGNIEQFSAKGMDINDALRFLSLQAHKNIIASKDVKGDVTANLFNVTFNQALDAILTPNGFGYVEKGNFIYVYTQKELDDIRKANLKTVNQIFHLHYINAADTAALIKPLLSSTGVISSTPAAIVGLPSGQTDTIGNGYATDDILIINDFPDNITEVGKALKMIDVRPKQVLVEATVLNASLTDNNAMGIDLVSLSGLNFSDIGSVISPISGSASTGTSGTSGSTSSGGVTTPGQLTGTLIPGLSNNQANIGTSFANQVPSGGLSLGFLSNHISVFLRALEEVTDTTIVANPKILALNKHHGEVHVGKKIGYKTTSTSQTTTQETVQFLDVGTKLIFRPFINDDGYIRMEIHPEQSDGAPDAAGIPQTTTTEVTSNIMVRDGRTIVIGGLFGETTTAARGQVPVLGNIPILGVPFRRTNDQTIRTETIVLLTPHIINDDTKLYEESEERAKDVNRMVLGNRAGLQPWGRDRIAQLWFGKSQEAADAGDKEKALMYTDWALNTNPRFIEAIKLREKLTNKRVEEADQSSISGFVRDTLKDDAAITPDTGSSGHYPPAEPLDPAATQPAK